MNRFENIICVAEPGNASTAALRRAVTLAQNNQARLTVVGVVPHVTAGIGMPDGGPISADLQAAIIADRMQGLQSLVDSMQDGIKPQLKVLVGVPFLEVIREVLRQAHDLVIKIPEQQQWLDRLFSSDDMHLLRKCPCPVWMIKPQAPKAYRRILAAVDVSDVKRPALAEAQHALNRQILQMAGSLAFSEFAELHVVHAWRAVGESAMRGSFLRTPEDEIAAYVDLSRQQHRDNLDALMQQARSDLGAQAFEFLTPHLHLVKGRADEQVPQVADQIEADLLVMGTVARTGIPGFIIGNTAETILSGVDCSILAIKPPGFATPVTVDD